MAANMHNDYADRKNGRKPVEYLHPDAEESLGDTYGLMIYQESLMRVAQKFAGYSFAEAHAYGYGLIAYQTAYLKANYAPEYLSCLLTSVKASLEKAAVYL